MEYVARPTRINAWKLTVGNAKMLADKVHARVVIPLVPRPGVKDFSFTWLHHEASVGDYIVEEAPGEFHPWDGDQFEVMFMEVGPHDSATLRDASIAKANEEIRESLSHTPVIIIPTRGSRY